MQRKLRILWWIIEINLVLWLIVVGQSMRDAGPADGVSWWRGVAAVDRPTILVGFAFAAIAQHWGYYAVYKAARLSSARNQPPAP